MFEFKCNKCNTIIYKNSSLLPIYWSSNIEIHNNKSKLYLKCPECNGIKADCYITNDYFKDIPLKIKE